MGQGGLDCASRKLAVPIRLIACSPSDSHLNHCDCDSCLPEAPCVEFTFALGSFFGGQLLNPNGYVHVAAGMPCLYFAGSGFSLRSFLSGDISGGKYLLAAPSSQVTQTLEHYI